MKTSGSEISFPIGGIGAGCIGLKANGEFIDWEIFNAPGKGKRLGLSHFCVRALDENGKPIAAKVLHGDAYPPYSGELQGKFGHGVEKGTLAGLPHFRDVSFEGKFPMAHLEFRDEGFPGPVFLDAWSVFVPGDSEISSLPVACYELTFTNNTAQSLSYSGVLCLCNHFSPPHAYNRLENNDSRTYLKLLCDLPQDDLQYGELIAATDAASTSGQEYLYRGIWSDEWEVYWHDVSKFGKLPPRSYPGISEDKASDGALEAQILLAPGETKSIRYLIAWYFPNRNNNWSGYSPEKEAELALMGVPNKWRNYYATNWTDAQEIADIVLDKYSELRKQVSTFTEAFYSSTIPEPALERIGADLSILVSPTCLRLESGTFYGWEGVHANRGSCEGSCAHVWNYAQALPLLFPDLERSMRIAHLKCGMDENDGLHFRLKLPLGIQAAASDYRPCVDGTFGEVMKCYREWRISGDNAFLREVYPILERVMAYTWSDKNYDHWDPDGQGILVGRQHHTLDLELFGPNAWLQCHYLGALKAMATMAAAMGKPDDERKYLEMFDRGKAYTKDELFNGEYFIQKIDIKDEALLRQYTGNPLLQGKDNAYDRYWDEEHGQIKYQIAQGVEIDMPLAQAYADLYGIGELLDRAQLRSTLKAIHRHNFHKSMRDVANTWRIFSLNDEAGTMICTWPEGVEKPVIPLSYNCETMSGFEWMFAVNLVLNDMLDEAEEVSRAISDRYDGVKRNPWNEIECGSNYARSMANYALLQAYAGFHYDMVEGSFSFSPKLPGSFRTFWSIGVAWGIWERLDNGTRCITVLHGKLKLNCLDAHQISLELNAGEHFEY